MKLIHNIAVRLSMALLPVIALWAMVFYFVIVDEINDEADDLLESYAEQLMVKKLSGKKLPVANIMTCRLLHSGDRRTRTCTISQDDIQRP